MASLLLTARRMDFVDSVETWQYSDTSHMKLSARHLSQDTRDELAGVLPTASWTKRSLHVSRAYSSQRLLRQRDDSVMTSICALMEMEKKTFEQPDTAEKVIIKARVTDLIITDEDTGGICEKGGTEFKEIGPELITDSPVEQDELDDDTKKTKCQDSINKTEGEEKPLARDILTRARML